MEINKNVKFLIVGLGLMGGSIAHRLSLSGYEVGAITLNQEDPAAARDGSTRSSSTSGPARLP